ncbi:MAG: YitT family protein [Pseudomonadota bacterium]
MTDASASPPRHSAIEDAAGFVTGLTLVALSLHLLASAGLTTGQTAGAALLISYAFDGSFALVFFVINIPFYLVAIAQMGWTFTLKTILAVALLSGLMVVLPPLVPFGDGLNPAVAGIVAGVLSGVGLLVLFRHGASLGGIGIVGLWLQDRIGLQAGWFQLAVDAVIFAAALLLLDWPLVVYSLAGAAVMNILVALNHRKDRYIAR